MVAAVDIEALLVEWVGTQFGIRACTELPGTVETILPVVQVVAIGGSSQHFSDSPRVDVDVYAATGPDAAALALQIRDRLANLRGPVGDAVVRGVRVDQRPATRPYENPALRRVGAAYSVFLRPTEFA